VMMSGPYVERTAERGEAATILGEEAVILALHAYGRRIGYSQIERMRDAVEALNPQVAALVAAAGREGEERGAAKERERIARQSRPTRLSDVVGVEEAARIMREEREREREAHRTRARRRRGAS